jgi:hypothetical protein
VVHNYFSTREGGILNVHRSGGVGIFDLIIFIWEKTPSQRQGDSETTLSNDNLMIVLRRTISFGGDHKFAAIA